GICGGYQMLGERIDDPDHVEGSTESIPGIGLLPVDTVLEKNKTTEQCTFQFNGNAEKCRGYEIHMGKTISNGTSSPLNTLDNNKEDGYYLNKYCWGTYIHGILDNKVVIDSLLEDLTDKKAESRSYQDFKEEQYNKLAEHLREYLDLSCLIGNQHLNSHS
ncbi:MAG: cobyric acid synthase, partial [Flavobacteriales bacterium]